MKPEEHTRVQVAQLKARLSEHLRTVRSGGTVVVVNRDTPVAVLAPPPMPTPPLVLRRRPLEAVALSKLTLPPAPQPPLSRDAVALLLEERGER